QRTAGVCADLALPYAGGAVGSQRVSGDAALDGLAADTGFDHRIHTEAHSFRDGGDNLRALDFHFRRLDTVRYYLADSRHWQPAGARVVHDRGDRDRPCGCGTHEGVRASEE